ncbi:MAG: sulfatase-like hydrolase/transferase [Paludibacteraceae bacterium]|nr:sulfatase-like hydrolase/transferase [Paludibacteraceae bacterium]
MKNASKALQPLCSVCSNLLLIYLVYTLLRLIFYWSNRSLFPTTGAGDLFWICLNGLRFDTTAILYLAAPYLILALLPLPMRDKAGYQKCCKALFLTGAFIGIFINCCDIPYFNFTLQRTTCNFFTKFDSDGHVAPIIAMGLVKYWYLSLFLIASMIGLARFYRPVRHEGQPEGKTAYLLLHSGIFVLALVVSVIGIRGWKLVGQPLGVNDASAYCKPIERPLVTNTVFTLIRTIDNRYLVADRKAYFDDQAALEAVFNPISQAPAKGPARYDNVVIFILEGFSKEFVGFFHPENKAYGNGSGWTPFLDSLLANSYTFTQSFANGKISVESVPAVLAGIPMGIDLQLTQPYATQSIGSLPIRLKERGYRTSYFHNSARTTLGIHAFMQTLGIDEYYALEDYPDQSQFDGTWGIWDEEFMQYMAQHLDTLPQPFLSGIFTTTSHHPFNLPERYRDSLPTGTVPMHQSVAYTDMALRRFFERVRDTDWYPNTLFVITADHTNDLCQKSSINPRGFYEIPILFFHPGDTLLRGVDSTHIMQQTDIYPSVLAYLNDTTKCLSFGCNVFDTPAKETFAFNYYNPYWQLYQDSLLLQFDGQQCVGLYNYLSDTYLNDNLLDSHPRAEMMERRIKAMLQQYMNRILDNDLQAR